MIEIEIQNIMQIFAQLIGVEGAEHILNEAISEAGLPVQPYYTEEQFQLICEKLEAKGGVVKMFASLVRTSEYREKQYQRIIYKESSEKKELAVLNRKMEELNAELSRSNAKLQEANATLKKMQEELLRTEKLATIGQLASSIAHELRNPLTGINNIRYYLQRYVKSDDPKVHMFMDLLARDIGRISTILTNLLDFSQEKDYKKVIIPLEKILDQAISAVNVPGNITVRREFCGMDRDLSLDPGRMEQVFSNVLVNGFDAMKDGGTMTVRTEIDTASGAGYARVTFTDTGAGMTKETAARIFEPLYSTKVRGIGLGLSIARDIVEGHSGKIFAESEEGKGSRFIILLPLRPQNP